MKLENYADVLKNGDIEEISNWTLTNIFSHYKKNNNSSFGIITTNDASQYIDLKDELDKLGIGFFKLKSIWETDRGEPLIEISLFALNIKEVNLNNLYKKYDKCSIIYEETAGMIYNSEKANIHSKMNNHKGTDFTFKGFQWIPTGMITNMALNALLKQ